MNSELRNKIAKMIRQNSAIGGAPGSPAVVNYFGLADAILALIQKEQGWRDELSDIIGELADRAAESDFGHFDSARKLEKRAYELLPTPPQGEDG